MMLLANPKLQDIMKAMMTGGASAATAAIKDDTESKELLAKLQAAMSK